uniref:Uncharacterized protein n=1 Tax=Acrobeloides nanus TaxID=290746 RepID=A0A914E1A0_9BILA
MFKVLFFIVLYYLGHFSCLGVKRQVIGECDQWEIDRVGYIDNRMALEFLSNLVCCSCGTIGQSIKTEYATCMCDREGGIDIKYRTSENPKDDGKPYSECFLKESLITEDFLKECRPKGRKGCSKMIEDLAVEVMKEYCKDEP